MSSPIPTVDYSDMSENVLPPEESEINEEDGDDYEQIILENELEADDWYPGNDTQEQTLQDIFNENVYGN